MRFRANGARREGQRGRGRWDGGAEEHVTQNYEETQTMFLARAVIFGQFSPTIIHQQMKKTERMNKL